MKYFIVAGFLLLSYSAFSQPKKILWLGNSYTGVNNLPQMFYDLSLSAGDTVIFDSNTPGGTTLQAHYNNTTSIQKISAQKWDYVVIQAQSQEPSFSPSQVEQQTMPYARLLDSLITANDSCTETVFYMTWGRKYGDQSNCANYPPICTFDGMQARLRESYLQMANDNHAITAPVGMAWHKSWHTDTLIDLWSSDFSHPSVAGTYLTACVFYATIFRKSPVGIVYSPISAQTTNDYLQGIAHQTVFDSLDNWNIGEFLPHADFEVSGDSTNGVYNFTHLSSNYSSYYYSFGDGIVSSFVSSHNYQYPGTFQVLLTVYDNCGNSDTSSKWVLVTGTVGTEDVLDNKLSLHPNPATEYLYAAFLEKQIGERFLILNTMGEVVSAQDISASNMSFDLSSLSPGIYICQTGENRKMIVKK